MLIVVGLPVKVNCTRMNAHYVIQVVPCLYLPRFIPCFLNMSQRLTALTKFLPNPSKLGVVAASFSGGGVSIMFCARMETTC